MKQEDLLKFCRYYHGEASCPFKDNLKSMLWDYERTWVQDMKNDADFSDVLAEYMNVGLRDFSETDDTPITLKAVLFNRFAKTAYTMQDAVSAFKDFYKKNY